MPTLSAVGSLLARPVALFRRTSPRLLAHLLAILLCLLALAGGALVSTGVFDRLPHVEDEVAFLFQARVIASGRMVASAPALPEFFQMPFVIVREGLWFGKYPPGYPAVLALGALAGQPWLINPVFGAICVGLIYLAGRRFYGASTGLLAAALAVVSPFFLLQAGSFLSHVVSLFWAVAFMVFFDAARRDRWWAAGAGAGVALGAGFLSRPLTTAGIAAPFVVWSAIDILRVRRRLLNYLPVVLAFLPFLAGLLAYNHFTTGNALRSAYELQWPYDRIGFGEGIGTAGRFTLDDGLLVTRINVDALSRYIFGWPGDLGLWPAAVAAGLAVARLASRGAGHLARRGRMRPVTPPGGPMGGAAASPEALDLLQAGIAVSLAGVYVAYWTAGQMYGPRYYFEAMGSLMLLSARGILQVADAAARVFRIAIPACRHPHAWTRTAILLVVAGLAVYSFNSFVPQEFNGFTRWYNIDGSGLRNLQVAKLENAVVFVKEESWTDYAPFFSQNVPTLDSNVVYAIDLGPGRNIDLMARYPGRSFFRYADGQLTPLAAP